MIASCHGDAVYCRKGEVVVANGEVETPHLVFYRNGVRRSCAALHASPQRLRPADEHVRGAVEVITEDLVDVSRVKATGSRAAHIPRVMGAGRNGFGFVAVGIVVEKVAPVVTRRPVVIVAIPRDVELCLAGVGANVSRLHPVPPAILKCFVCAVCTTRPQRPTVRC